VRGEFFSLRVRGGEEQNDYTVEPLITDTDGEFQFCPLQGVFVSWGTDFTIVLVTIRSG
jgi:hypothetical protein